MLVVKQFEYIKMKCRFEYARVTNLLYSLDLKENSFIVKFSTLTEHFVLPSSFALEKILLIMLCNIRQLD